MFGRKPRKGLDALDNKILQAINETPKGQKPPSNQQLAAKLGAKDFTIRDRAKRLCRLGYLNQEQMPRPPKLTPEQGLNDLDLKILNTAKELEKTGQNFSPSLVRSNLENPPSLDSIKRRIARMIRLGYWTVAPRMRYGTIPILNEQQKEWIDKLVPLVKQHSKQASRGYRDVDELESFAYWTLMKRVAETKETDFETFKTKLIPFLVVSIQNRKRNFECRQRSFHILEFQTVAEKPCLDKVITSDLISTMRSRLNERELKIFNLAAEKLIPLTLAATELGYRYRKAQPIIQNILVKLKEFDPCHQAI